MKRILLIGTTLLVGSAAFAYEPAEERELSDIAANGCRDRDGDFIVRGLVGNATKDTVVLADPADERTSMSLTLPGRGPLARVRGAFGTSKHEAAEIRLNELRADGTPVVATLRCRGNGTPTARNISYFTADGSRESITF